MVNAVLLITVLVLPTLLGLAVAGGRRLWQMRDRRSPQPVAMNQPIERIAADLRRLRRQRALHQAEMSRPGRHLRSRALTAAYLDVLAAACRALEVTPPRVPESGRSASSSEIRRVETELHRRGLDVGQVKPG
jgi:hypothetical protein